MLYSRSNIYNKTMILTIENLSLQYDKKQIFAPISLSLLPGSIVFLSGKNGSGKTSFLRMIAGIIALQGEGRILINDIPISELPKPYLNFIEHQIAVLDHLTILENLEFWSVAYGSEIMIPSALSYFKLTEMMDQKSSELSAGNKKKVALARLACCDSDLWLLDEVEVNLDEENRALLYNMIAIKANNGGIVIISSHTKPPFENMISISL
jgi:heme exporter protein A